MLQKREIFLFDSSLIFFEVLQTNISGCIPTLKSSLTECYVGLVLNSFDDLMNGIRVR